MMSLRNRDKIRQKLNIDAMASLPFRKSRDVLAHIQTPMGLIPRKTFQHPLSPKLLRLRKVNVSHRPSMKI